MGYDIAIIGAGAAGIEAALSACRAGLKTVLISDLPVGGRTAYSDMVPAQIWKETGRLIQHGFSLSGILPFEYRPTMNDVKATIEAAGDDWSIQEQRELVKNGVVILQGTAQITGMHTITVRSQGGENKQQLTARAIIACTGTLPMNIPGIAVDGTRILYPKHLKSLTSYPEKAVIIGGGCSACEYASALSDLMVEVTVLCETDQILPRLDRQIAEEMQQELEARGISIQLNSPVVSAELRGKSIVAVNTKNQTYTAHIVLICTHRTQDYSFLAESFPLFYSITKNSISVDIYGRTVIPWLFLAGSLVGDESLTQARISARRTVGAIAAEFASELPSPVPPYQIPTLISTNPLAGMIGTIPTSNAKVLHFYYSQLPLTRIRQIAGHLKLWVNPFGKIEAAAMFGDGTKEVLAVISLAMNAGISYGDLSSIPLCSPSVSELLSYPPMKIETV